ncbi:N-acetyltransferase [Flavobacterium cyanobacteriorum]|uniref:N-acetyltransferase n=1 Tax=Flavobacterium cyanobacteriorum TaxID=2022802 RepID=A0A255Z987_9FLAO|nr:N-acetyltransferase [Flavobacterium cyanobacteriorum]OYQ38028.1 N-acetyltransferase [Flavobacterium cyanobacteriorum]
MEIKDNEFSRQFETSIDGKLLSVEYSIQERKLFLTRINVPENTSEETVSEFLTRILDTAEQKKQKVVPTHPKVTAFFRKNPKYKELLPPGIRL